LLFINEWFDTFKKHKHHSDKFKRIRDIIAVKDEVDSVIKYSLNKLFNELITTSLSAEGIEQYLNAETENKFNDANNAYTLVLNDETDFGKKFIIESENDSVDINIIKIVEKSSEENIATKYLSKIKSMNEHKIDEIQKCKELFDLIEKYPTKINDYFNKNMSYKIEESSFNIESLKSNLKEISSFFEKNKTFNDNNQSLKLILNEEEILKLKQNIEEIEKILDEYNFSFHMLIYISYIYVNTNHQEYNYL
jgi:hypothetical protein